MWSADKNHHQQPWVSARNRTLQLEFQQSADSVPKVGSNGSTESTTGYEYDGLGRRIRKYNPIANTTTFYRWDGDTLASEITLTGK